MRWPWHKPEPKAEESHEKVSRVAEVPESESTKSPEIDLAELSIRNMEEWFASPFWKVLAQWLGEEIELNKLALLRGDQALSMNSKEGLCYRNDDTLRGGIIGMEFVRTLFPKQLRQEIEEALAERRDNEKEEPNG